MSLKVNTSQNPAQHGAEMLSLLVAEAKDHSVFLMLSAGSSFELLKHIDVSKGFEHVTITMIDERYSTDEEINNFAQLSKTEFYKKVLTAGASFLDTHIAEGESLNEAEVQMGYALKSWIHDNPGGVVIATMGIGADGHTAGIFPHENDEKFLYLFEQDERFITSYHTHNSEYHERITVTNHFLREYVDHAIVYAVGSKKKAALEKIIQIEGTLAQTPARIMREMKDVSLFTDVIL